MKIKRNNSWVYTTTVDVPPNDSAKLAIDLGISNGLTGLKFRIETFGAGLASHRLSLYGDETITNTNDPASGYNRFLDTERFAEKGLNPSVDQFLFHAPGTFTDGGGGILLYDQVCPTAMKGNTGKWKIRTGNDPRYMMAKILNLDSISRPFTFVVHYGFMRK